MVSGVGRTWIEVFQCFIHYSDYLARLSVKVECDRSQSCGQSQPDENPPGSHRVNFRNQRLFGSRSVSLVSAGIQDILPRTFSFCAVKSIIVLYQHFCAQSFGPEARG